MASIRQRNAILKSASSRSAARLARTWRRRHAAADINIHGSGMSGVASASARVAGVGGALRRDGAVISCLWHGEAWHQATAAMAGSLGVGIGGSKIWRRQRAMAK